MQKEVESKLDGILTAEQKKQYKEMRENAGRGGPGGRGGFGGAVGSPREEEDLFKRIKKMLREETSGFIFQSPKMTKLFERMTENADASESRN